MLLGLVVLGSGAVVAAVVGGAAYLLLRRRAIAGLAGVAAAMTWVLFLFESALYSVGEYGPEYYSFSDYVKYRDAIDSVWGVPIGCGYAVLAGALVVVGALLSRRWGRGWALASAPVVAAAVALPLIVPDVLPRVEYGKDPVFYMSHANPTKACFIYGVERPGFDHDNPPNDPELCLSRLRGRPKVHDLELELNESGVRPYDHVPHGHWGG
jgi:hypothetical protein